MANLLHVFEHIAAALNVRPVVLECRFSIIANFCCEGTDTGAWNKDVGGTGAWYKPVGGTGSWYKPVGGTGAGRNL